MNTKTIRLKTIKDRKNISSKSGIIFDFWGYMVSVAAELSYSIGYINKLNNGLVKYLYNYFDKNGEDK